MEGGMGGNRADVDFDLRGQNMQKLEELSIILEDKIKDLPSTTNVTTTLKAGKPEISIYPNRFKLLQSGLTVADIAMAIRGSISGIESSSYKEDGEEYDILVTLKDESVDSPQEIANIPVVGPKGTYRLEQVADISFTKGYSSILRMNRAKAININMDAADGYTTGDVQKDIKGILSEMELPPGYSIRWGGMTREMEKSVREILRAFIIAILLTYMLLAAILESLVQPLLILGTVPMALIGVVFAMLITGLSMNIISMLAIVMLIGIVVNNAILQLDYTNNLVRNNGMKSRKALLIACPAKLKPILMSSIAIILGMMPMAMGVGSSGVELRQPMGVVSIGGLLSSAILSLYVIPVLYNLSSKEKKS